MGVFRVTFPATELRVIRYVFSFSQIKLALYRGNNREIPFVGVASVVHYEQSLPMSANHVLIFMFLYSQGVSNSHCRTSVRKGFQNKRQAKNKSTV